MSDVREALVALIPPPRAPEHVDHWPQDEQDYYRYGDFSDWAERLEVLDRMRREKVADAILAEFDVTLPGEGADAELRAEVERLRARIERVEALTEGLLTDEGWNDPEVETVLLIQRRYRAVLAGAGEQPGGRCYCRHDYHDTDCPEGWPEGARPAPVAPDVVRELDAVMHHHADRADASEAEVERLREGIEALRQRWEGEVLTGHGARREGLRKALDDLRALLAGSGERPGEPVGTLRVSDWPDGKTAEVRLRSAPAVPDSADVRDITDQVRYAWCWYGGATREESDQRAAQFDTWLASLAVVGQGMTAEPVAVVERVHEDRPVITARVYAPESWKHLGPGTHLHAAVRPTGQEGS